MLFQSKQKPYSVVDEYSRTMMLLCSCVKYTVKYIVHILTNPRINKVTNIVKYPIHKNTTLNSNLYFITIPSDLLRHHTHHYNRYRVNVKDRETILVRETQVTKATDTSLLLVTSKLWQPLMYCWVMVTI